MSRSNFFKNEEQEFDKFNDPEIRLDEQSLLYNYDNGNNTFGDDRNTNLV